MPKKWINRAIVASGFTLSGRLLALLALIGLVLLGNAGSAAAHNALIGSDPPDGGSLSTGPARVSLTFNLPVQSGFSTVTVTGPDNTQWQAGPPTENGAVVSAPVRPLGPAGQYTVAYQVLSADGHPVRGAVRFTLTNPGPGSAAESTPTATPSTANRAGDAATQPESGSTPLWPWLAGAGLLLVAGVAFALRVSRSGS